MKSQAKAITQAEVYRARTALMMIALAFASFCAFAQIARMIAE